MPDAVESSLTMASLLKTEAALLVTLIFRERALAIAIVAVAVLIVSALPADPQWTIPWLAAYTLYVAIRRLCRSLLLPATEGPSTALREEVEPVLQQNARPIYDVLAPLLERWEGKVTLARAYLMVIGVTVFLTGLQARGVYGAGLDGRDTLWILFVLALHSLGEDSRPRIRHLVGGVLLAWAGLILTESLPLALADGHSLSIGLPALVSMAGSVTPKLLWTGLLSLMYYTVGYLLAVWWQGIQLLERFAKNATTTQELGDTEKTIQELVNDLWRTFNFHTVLVMQPSDDDFGDQLTCTAAAGVYSDTILGGILHYDESLFAGRIGIWRYAVNEQRPYATNDAASDPYFRAIREMPSVRSELVHPILLGSQVVGLLAVESTERFAFRRIHQAVLQIAAALISQVIAIEETERGGQILERLVQARLGDARTHSAVLQEVAVLGVELYGARFAVCYGYDSGTGRALGPYWTGAHEQERPTGARSFSVAPNTPLSQAIEAPAATRFDLLLREADGQDPVPHVQWPAARARLRLEKGTTCVGVLYLYFPRSSHFHASERHRLTGYGTLAGCAIGDRVEQLAGRPGQKRADQTLSPRQQQIAEALTHGLSNKQIAERLGISTNAVRAYMEEIANRLNVKGRVAIAVSWVSMHTGETRSNADNLK